MTLIVVVGATTAGKSDLAVDLALAVGGEVVNADSMQLYQGMDIGTAKLTEAERRGVPHHLLDVWDVSKTASVAEYQELADAALTATVSALAALAASWRACHASPARVRRTLIGLSSARR